MIIKFTDLIQPGEKNSSLALSRAITALNSGDTLQLGGETLHFYKDGTSNRFIYISNNDSGEKNIVFDLNGKEDITVDGEGAELIFHGEILPFALHAYHDMKINIFATNYYLHTLAQRDRIKRFS